MKLIVAFRNLAKAPHCRAPTYKEQKSDAYVYIHTCMPRVKFKPRIPMFEKLQTVNALDRAVAITGPSTVKPDFLLTYLPTSYLSTYLLHEAESFLRS
jgi:hypothetical protein